MRTFGLKPAAATHKGMRRRHNEDAIAYEYPTNPDILQSYGTLFVVADGVGGLASGDKASQMTVENLIKYYYASDESLNIQERLINAIQDVNTDVYTTFMRKGATTLVAIVVIDEKIIAASAGDSQIFHIVNDTITQLNTEDVLRSNDSDNGALTKAIGYRKQIDIETIQASIKVDDKLLLCSDGLTRYLSNQELANLSKLRDPRDSVRRMITQANTSGGADNISAILVQVGQTIDPQNISQHVNNLSIRVAIDEDPHILHDVPSKPTTQIPNSRSKPVIDESLLGTPDLPQKKVKPNITPVSAKHSAHSSQKNNLTLIIVVAVVILAIGAVIFGIALASLNNNSVATPTSMQDNIISTDENGQLATETSNEIQINDIVIFDETILTTNNIGSDIGSFLVVINSPYMIENITEDSEGQLWYLLSEEETNQTGWLAASDLPTYTIQRD